MQCFPVALTLTHAGQLPTFFFASYGRFMIDRFSLPFKKQLFYKLQKHSYSTGWINLFQGCRYLFQGVPGLRSVFKIFKDHFLALEEPALLTALKLICTSSLASSLASFMQAHASRMCSFRTSTLFFSPSSGVFWFSSPFHGCHPEHLACPWRIACSGKGSYPPFSRLSQSCWRCWWACPWSSLPFSRQLPGP